MKINIPAEKAIEILKKRQSELFQYNFEPNVWKGKTENDLSIIFGPLSEQKMQINRIRFISQFSETRHSTLENGKKQATGFIESFIEQIEYYSEIENQQNNEKENYFEEKNNELERKIKSLKTNYEVLSKEIENLKSEVIIKSNKIVFLQNNTVQLNEISLKKIFNLISHLPISQLIGSLSILLGVVGFSFFLGTLIQENSNKTDNFNNNKSLTELNDSIKKLNKQVEITTNENLKNKSKLDSLSKTKK
jgi:hypothetical protein